MRFPVRRQARWPSRMDCSPRSETNTRYWSGAVRRPMWSIYGVGECFPDLSTTTCTSSAADSISTGAALGRRKVACRRDGHVEEAGRDHATAACLIHPIAARRLAPSFDCSIWATLLAHRFWELAGPERTMQMNSFFEHLTISAASFWWQWSGFANEPTREMRGQAY